MNIISELVTPKYEFQCFRGYIFQGLVMPLNNSVYILPVDI